VPMLTTGEDCAGNAHAMADGMDALSWRGVYMNVAIWASPVCLQFLHFPYLSIYSLHFGSLVRTNIQTQFSLPFEHFMLKEITVKSSMAYNDEDFKETVEAFNNGMFVLVISFFHYVCGLVKCRRE